MSSQQSDYQTIMKYMSSLSKLDGRRPRSRPSTANREKHIIHAQQDDYMDTVTWLPKNIIDTPRFEIPIDVRVLSSMTPVQYLTKYCIVTSRVKKLLYHRHYGKYREPRADGIDTLDKLKRSLKDVCTFSVNAQTHSPTDGSLNYYLHGILGFGLEENIRVIFKSFLGIAALAERIFNPNYMASWQENEKQLESDYQHYKNLREQEVELQERLERKEAERLQTQKKAEVSISARNRLLADISPVTDNSRTSPEPNPELDLTPSEEELSKQVQEHRNQLENKISITKILELESRPNRCPKEVMEQVDFHALKWKLNGVELSPQMQRLVRIIINL